MLKALIKHLVGEDSWSFLSWSRDRFGLVTTMSNAVQFFRHQRMGIATAPNILTGGRRVFIRPGSVDQLIYDEIFLNGEYDIDLGSPKFIVDAGAHIGLASVFFASKYPDAQVIAIEPEAKNFFLLQKNSEAYPNIKPIQAGLWSKTTRLRIENGGVESWGFRVSEHSSENGIPAISIPDIMSEYQIPAIDVLKLDIEGSEYEVLTHSQGWIGATRTLIIELHDRFQPGCSQALEAALRPFQYERSKSRESVVIKNLRIKHENLIG